MAELIRANEVALQPWRNGGGQTRELLAWPSTEQCNLRIALADIEVDGPFSVYDGVERWIVVISGVGIELRFRNGDHQLHLGDNPLRFDGADAPDCRLLDGATRDLNLMVQGGVGVMQAMQPGIAWNENYAVRGLFTVEGGHWQAGDESCLVPAMTLLWDEHASGAWTFNQTKPTTVTQAWWLGFSPTK